MVKAVVALEAATWKTMLITWCSVHDGASFKISAMLSDNPYGDAHMFSRKHTRVLSLLENVLQIHTKR